MRYSAFEALAALFGGLAVVGTVIAGIVGSGDPAEVLAQLMLLPILLAALHYGRNGGFLAALFATALYLGVRVPAIQSFGLTPPLTTLLVQRAAAYLVVGVLGGELCSRIKYVFARLERRGLIDDETDVYSRRHVGAILKTLMAEENRYATPFSACVLTLDSAVVPIGDRRQARPLMREIAGVIRGDVRAVDDVGRFSDGGFLVLFPNTRKPGAEIAGARLLQAVVGVLSRRDVHVSSAAASFVAYGYPEDSARLVEIAEALTGEAFTPGAQRTAAGQPA